MSSGWTDSQVPGEMSLLYRRQRDGHKGRQFGRASILNVVVAMKAANEGEDNDEQMENDMWHQNNQSCYKEVRVQIT